MMPRKRASCHAKELRRPSPSYAGCWSRFRPICAACVQSRDPAGRLCRRAPPLRTRCHSRATTDEPDPARCALSPVDSPPPASPRSASLADLGAAGCVSGGSPLPVIGSKPSPARSPRIVQARTAAAEFVLREVRGHRLMRSACTTGLERGHAAQLRRLGSHKSFDVLGDYLVFANPFDGYSFQGVCSHEGPD
jgi:hypothetical protein